MCSAMLHVPVPAGCGCEHQVKTFISKRISGRNVARGNADDDKWVEFNKLDQRFSESERGKDWAKIIKCTEDSADSDTDWTERNGAQDVKDIVSGVLD